MTVFVRVQTVPYSVRYSSLLSVGPYASTLQFYYLNIISLLCQDDCFVFIPAIQFPHEMGNFGREYTLIDDRQFADTFVVPTSYIIH